MMTSNDGMDVGTGTGHWDQDRDIGTGTLGPGRYIGTGTEPFRAASRIGWLFSARACMNGRA